MQDWRADKRSHLHSTMYLFQLCVWCRLFVLMIDLHSTMYLFQLACDFIISMRCSIYIPLCIYFNLAFQPTVLLCSRFTFHYVSISTFTQTLCWLFTFIYIPLCIYFNLNQFTQKFTITVIYIPLCIYFNKLSRDTMLWLQLDLHSTMYLFQHGNYWHLRSTCF